MRAALDIHRELLADDVPHEIVRLRGTLLSADDLPDVLGVDARCCVCVRCYVSDAGFLAVVVGAGTVPDPATLLDAIAARSLRVATADEINLATDYAAGLVSPLGLLPSTLLLADAALLGQEVVYCPVGEGGVALGIRTEHLLATSGARVVPLSPLRLSEQLADPLDAQSRRRRSTDRTRQTDRAPHADRTPPADRTPYAERTGHADRSRPGPQPPAVVDLDRPRHLDRAEDLDRPRQLDRAGDLDLPEDLDLRGVSADEPRDTGGHGAQVRPRARRQGADRPAQE